MNPRTSIDEAFWAMLAAAHLPGEQYTDPPGDPGLFGPGSRTGRSPSSAGARPFRTRPGSPATPSSARSGTACGTG
ncbi:hypothetical protein [Actinoallomurus sp. NPDC050550]|uniref:hypothetical protein n=1 Tax=Actinoallomurus sp. NPDC050550 TaxID=3154937 RepID=UPI0033F2015B